MVAEVDGRREPTVAAAPDLFAEQQVAWEEEARGRSDPHQRDKPDDRTITTPRDRVGAAPLAPRAPSC